MRNFFFTFALAAVFFAFGMCMAILFVTLVRAQSAPPASEQALGNK